MWGSEEVICLAYLVQNVMSCTVGAPLSDLHHFRICSTLGSLMCISLHLKKNNDPKIKKNVIDLKI